MEKQMEWKNKGLGVEKGGDEHIVQTVESMTDRMK